MQLVTLEERCSSFKNRICVLNPILSITERSVKTFAISVTNDGVLYGNEVRLTVFDSSCQSCNGSNCVQLVSTMSYFHINQRKVCFTGFTLLFGKYNFVLKKYVFTYTKINDVSINVIIIRNENENTL